MNSGIISSILFFIECVMGKRKRFNTKRKGDGTMSAILKPRTGAFVLRADRSKEFFSQEKNKADKTIDRFLAHKPKDGIVNPFKNESKI